MSVCDQRRRVGGGDWVRYWRGRASGIPTVPVDTEATLTTDTRVRADGLFDARVARAAGFKAYKVADKRRYWRYLFHAARMAHYRGGAVRFCRNKNVTPSIHIQVVDCAVAAGLFTEVRSRKGSTRMTRLVPDGRLFDDAVPDPWTFDPRDVKQYVFLRDRKTKEAKDFDMSAGVPAMVQDRLMRVNEVNAKCEILYRKHDYWEDRLERYRRLRPVHYALFTDTFELHGRLYTGKYGHQGLSRVERATILFGGELCVEMDYSGLHPRLLYHLEGTDYPHDPYALWGDRTTPPLRVMAKVLVNALINAESERSAVSACNRKMSPYTGGEGPDGKRTRKTGKGREEAARLYEAHKTTGAAFADLVPLVKTYHAPIAHHFGKDEGIRLMLVDSAIALDVLYHFAGRSVPCLGCHDSFLVPRHAAQELYETMGLCYEERVGNLPVIR
jgi:hypothetical protein